MLKMLDFSTTFALQFRYIMTVLFNWVLKLPLMSNFLLSKTLPTRKNKISTYKKRQINSDFVISHNFASSAPIFVQFTRSHFKFSTGVIYKYKHKTNTPVSLFIHNLHLLSEMSYIKKPQATSSVLGYWPWQPNVEYVWKIAMALSIITCCLIFMNHRG